MLMCPISWAVETPWWHLCVTKLMSAIILSWHLCDLKLMSPNVLSCVGQQASCWYLCDPKLMLPNVLSYVGQQASCWHLCVVLELIGVYRVLSGAVDSRWPPMVSSETPGGRRLHRSHCGGPSMASHSHTAVNVYYTLGCRGELDLP